MLTLHEGPFPSPPRHAQTAAREKHPAGPPPPPSADKFNYNAFYENELDKKHKDKSYRYFNNINRLAAEFPRAHMNAAEERGRHSERIVVGVL